MNLVLDLNVGAESIEFQLNRQGYNSGYKEFEIQSIYDSLVVLKVFNFISDSEYSYYTKKLNKYILDNIKKGVK